MCHIFPPGNSLMFSTAGQLVFTGGQNYLTLISLQESLSSRRSNLAGKIILRATSSQFVRGKCLSCFLQCATTKVEGFLHLCILHCMCISINYILINIWNAQYSHVQPGARIKSIMSRSDIEMILNTLFPCCFVGYD